jgi:nucleoid-associated protein YgaU
MMGPSLPVRLCLRSGVVTAAALALFATTSPAQDSTAMHADATRSGSVDAAGFRTHTVRAGETLWDIAHTYLGDGDLWPEITRLNHGLVRDPHWIFPNEVLRIPPRPPGVADSTVAVASATPAAPVAPSAVTQPTETPSTPVEPALAAQPAEPNADAASASPAVDDASSPMTGSTLFNHPAQPTAMSAQPTAMFAAGRGSSLINRKREGVSAGEHNAAPYLDRDGGPLHAGTVVGVTDVSNVINTADVEHYSLHQDIYITMPLGSRPEVGQRFFTYRLADSFGDRGQVVEPTGIVMVIQPGDAKIATVARIVQQFSFMQLGQGVLPVDQAILPSGSASALPGGPQSHVVWVEHNQVLPTIGFYVVVDASAKSGVRLGDQVTLFRPRQPQVLPSGSGSIMLPESEVAIAQVVRVGAYGSTAIIIAQDQPAITPGIGARVTARINGTQ